MTELDQEKNTVLHKTCNRLTDENEKYKIDIFRLDRDSVMYKKAAHRLEVDLAAMTGARDAHKFKVEELEKKLHKCRLLMLDIAEKHFAKPPAEVLFSGTFLKEARIARMRTKIVSDRKGRKT